MRMPLTNYPPKMVSVFFQLGQTIIMCGSDKLEKIKVVGQEFRGKNIIFFFFVPFAYD